MAAAAELKVIRSSLKTLLETGEALEDMRTW